MGPPASKRRNLSPSVALFEDSASDGSGEGWVAPSDSQLKALEEAAVVDWDELLGGTVGVQGDDEGFQPRQSTTRANPPRAPVHDIEDDAGFSGTSVRKDIVDAMKPSNQGTKRPAPEDSEDDAGEGAMGRLSQVSKLSNGEGMDVDLSTVPDPDLPLEHLLRGAFVPPGSTLPYTHQGLWGPYKGRFNLSSPTLRKGLPSAVARHLAAGGTFGLAEVPTEITPLRYDIDFRFDVTRLPEDQHGIRQFHASEITDFVNIVKEACLKVFDPDRVRAATAYVFTRDTPYIDRTVVKDGIHIMIPDLAVPNYVHYVIRHHILRAVKSASLFARHMEYFTQYHNYPGDVVDKGIVSAAYLMYGSQKKEDLGTYELRAAFDLSIDHVNVETAADLAEKFKEVNSPQDLVEKFSIRRVGPDTRIMTPLLDQSAVQEFYSENVERKSPNLMSTGFRASTNTAADIRLAKDLVRQCLSVDRASIERQWMEVGWALHNIGGKDLFSAWDDWSRKSVNYRSGDCERKWRHFQHRGLGMAALKRWAQKDNPQGYEAAVKDLIEVHLQHSLLGGKKHAGKDIDLVTILHMMFKTEFICANIKKNTWYRFVEHGWEEDEEGVTLRGYIHTKLRSHYIRMSAEEKFNQATQMLANDGAPNKENAGEVSVPFVIAQKLLDDATLSRLVRTATYFFHDKNFYTRQDANRRIIRFQNGVYDATDPNNHFFRDGYPEDYCTYTTGINYVDYGDPVNRHRREWKDMLSFINQIHPDQEVRDCWLKVMGISSMGDNPEEMLPVFKGTTRAGKSKGNLLITGALGTYVDVMNSTVATRGRTDSSAASPDIAMMVKKRIIFVQEPEQSETLYVGKLKEYSGRDPIYWRDLYSKPATGIPQWTIVLVSNHDPKLSAQDRRDKAWWERCIVIPYGSYFGDVHNPGQRKFLRDPNIIDRLPDMYEPFAWYLLHHYRKYLVEGLERPEAVRLAQQQYKDSEDRYAEFFQEYIHRTTDEEREAYDQLAKKHWVKTMKTFQDFVKYIEKNYPGEKSGNRKELVEYMNERFGEQDTRLKAWTTIKLDQHYEV
jgi:phage/plasmid-associated DNA primase